MLEQEELTEDEVSNLRDAAFDAGVEFRLDYSGRNMYGAICPAVSGDLGSLAIFFSVLTAYDFDYAWERANDFAQDSMGLGFVFYWPDYCVPLAMLQEAADKAANAHSIDSIIGDFIDQNDRKANG
jgi:hypothetical protein